MELRFNLNRQLWVGIVSLLLGGLVYWHASGWDPGSSKGQALTNASFPLMLAAALMLTGALLVIRSRKIAGEPAGLRLLGPTAIALALIFGTFLLIPYLGFFVTTFLFVLGMLLLLRGTSWWQSALIAGAIVLVVRTVFYLLLKVQFPTGSLFD